jgi:predicted ester cyclase
MFGTNVTEGNKALILRLIDAMDRNDLSILDQICDPDLVAHFIDAELNLGQIRAAAAGFIASFPDVTHTIVEIVATDDRVVLRAVDRATHRGPYKGIGATGRIVEFETVATYRIADGKIAEIWQQMDVEALIRQLTGD